jgi:hypothetical protein
MPVSESHIHDFSWSLQLLQWYTRWSNFDKWQRLPKTTCFCKTHHVSSNLRIFCFKLMSSSLGTLLYKDADPFIATWLWRACKSTKGAIVGRPCAQLKQSWVAFNDETNWAHSVGSSGSPNMSALRHALALRVRMTAGGSKATPWVSANWCK